MEKLRKNTCRKAISFFVAGLLTIACLPANVSVFSAAWNGTVDTSWYQADETQLSISNPEELAGLAKLVNDGTTNFEGVTITLEADLQMNPLTNWEKWETAEVQPSNTWVPIGIVNQSLFHGTFDGNGHTISGLYAQKNGETGLFAGLYRTATVKNLTIEKSYLSSYDTFAGGICGYNYKGTIENCENRAVISSWYYMAGGICGVNFNGTVSRCSNDAFISGQEAAGGITGQSIYATVSESCSTGRVSSLKFAGGVVGKESNGTVQNCYSTGAIKGNTAAGGIVGSFEGGSIETCFNIGTVSGDEKIGGVVGDSNATCTACYYQSDVTDKPPIDQEICTAMKQSDMQKATFAQQLGAAFSGITGSYPLLCWQQRHAQETTTDTTTAEMTKTTTTATATITTTTTTKKTTTGTTKPSNATTTSATTTQTTTVTSLEQPVTGTTLEGDGRVVTQKNIKEIHQIGGTLQLYYLGEKDEVPQWVSTDDNIATIDQDGLLTAVSEGSVIVGALVNQKFYKLTITISVPKTTAETTIPIETETTDLTTATTEPVTTTIVTTTTTLPDPYEMGDVDGDSMVSVDDAVQILTYYARRAAGYTTFFSEIAHINDLATSAADINGDGVISVEDAVAVLTYYAMTASGMQPSWADVIGTSSKQANTESGEPIELSLPEEFALLLMEDTE